MSTSCPRGPTTTFTIRSPDHAVPVTASISSCTLVSSASDCSGSGGTSDPGDDSEGCIARPLSASSGCAPTVTAGFPAAPRAGCPAVQFAQSTPRRAGGAMARTLAVSSQLPGAYRTIQDALEMAPDDAVIRLAPGTYAEAIVLEKRRISLVSSGEPGSVTIDARETGRPAVTGRGADITLQGLVLKAGDTAAVTAAGGRLSMRQCEVAA